MSETGKTIALIEALKGSGGGGGGSADDIVLNATPTYQDGYWTIAITSQLPSASDLEAWFNENRHIVLHFSNDAWYARLYAAEKDISSDTYYSFTGYGENFDGEKIRYLVKFSVSGSTVSCVASAYIDGKFIVTLTPTAPDYSGTMDKTVAEINAAYEAGMEIVFRIFASATFYYDIVATVSSFAASDDAKRFSGFGILYDNLVQIITPVGEENTYYGTSVYSLTPAS